MFNRLFCENTLPGGFGVLEVVKGQREEGPRMFVPLKRTGVCGEVTGPLASLRLKQVFSYSKNECGRVLEGLYRFPLPGDAAVTSARVFFGNVEIATELRERAEAETAYKRAVDEGRQAVLASRESPDVFTLRIAGLEPGRDITVETSFIQLARPEGAGWTLRIPLTTPPRYVRSDERGTRHACGQPLLLLRDPGHRFAFNLTFSKTGMVNCLTHRIDVKQEEDVLRVFLKEGEVMPDRDCVLHWQMERRESPALDVMLHQDVSAGEVYFLALVAPPAVHGAKTGLPREVILLVDHSGSMTGPKWEAADWAVKKFLGELGEKDWFNLCLFHDRTRWFARKTVPAAAGNIRKAAAFLQKHRDSGGTELGVALEQALHMERADGEPARHVLIITDAAVTDAGRILRLVDQEFGRRDRRRISILCIDAAPNSYLAVQLAERGGGAARFLTSNPDEQDISTALEQIMEEWAEPVMTGLTLAVDRPGVCCVGRNVLAGGEAESIIDLGDLSAGRAIWVAGRTETGESNELNFLLSALQHGRLAGRCRRLDEFTAGGRAVRALFGARLINGLEYIITSGYAGEELEEQLARLGYDPEKVLAGGKTGKPKVYAENAGKDLREALKSLLLRESLDCGLICSETAFIAARKEAGKVVEETVVVPGALPYGWSDIFLSDRAVFLPEDVDIYMPAYIRRRKPSEAVKYSTIVEESGGVAGETDNLPDKTIALFAGIPSFSNGEAVLFDSSRKQDAEKLPGRVRISHLAVNFPAGSPDFAKTGGQAYLYIFMDDLSVPRAAIRLADIMRQGGRRPLNLLTGCGGIFRVVLSDPQGDWEAGARTMKLLIRAA